MSINEDQNNPKAIQDETSRNEDQDDPQVKQNETSRSPEMKDLAFSLRRIVELGLRWWLARQSYRIALIGAGFLNFVILTVFLYFLLEQRSQLVQLQTTFAAAVESLSSTRPDLKSVIANSIPDNVGQSTGKPKTEESTPIRSETSSIWEQWELAPGKALGPDIFLLIQPSDGSKPIPIYKKEVRAVMQILLRTKDPFVERYELTSLKDGSKEQTLFLDKYLGNVWRMDNGRFKHVAVENLPTFNRSYSPSDELVESLIERTSGQVLRKRSKDSTTSTKKK